jgi:hypothetical protein
MGQFTHQELEVVIGACGPLGSTWTLLHRALPRDDLSSWWMRMFCMENRNRFEATVGIKPCCWLQAWDGLLTLTL